MEYALSHKSRASLQMNQGASWKLALPNVRLVIATWNNTVIAESNDTVVVEENHYFPPDSIRREYFRESTQHTHCPWKGEASYYDIVIDDAVNAAAAWYYSAPKEAAAQITDHVAFWKGVSVA